MNDLLGLITLFFFVCLCLIILADTIKYYKKDKFKIERRRYPREREVK